jgi:hypothetical protein
MKVTAFIAFLLLSTPALYAQQDQPVTLMVVTPEGSTKEYKFKLPPPGPPSTGEKSMILKKVNAILQENEIDCPPKREKVGENIWKCGNGKLVKTPDAKLARILSKAWDE